LVAIVPAPLLSQDVSKGLDPSPALRWWVRGSLLVVGALLILVFGIAIALDPYVGGEPRRTETHTQLGLPPCNFRVLTGRPCPMCGMTTSFALVMHGNVLAALQANIVGVLMASFGLFVLPWSLASAIRGRAYFVRSIEQAATAWVLVFFLL